MADENSDMVYDLVIIGGGVVGLAILRAAALNGYKCAVVEQEADLLSWASGSNSGIVCTGVDASPGTLERALIRDAISQIRIYCEQMNIPTRPCGSLVCQWPWDKENRLNEVLLESHQAGDTHAKLLSSEEVTQLEPNLHEACSSAVHIPGEIVVDPWLYSISLGVHARQNGAHIYTNFEMDTHMSAWDGEFWTIVQKLNRKLDNSLDSEKRMKSLRTKAVVNATGLWADIIQSNLVSKSEDSPLFEARPRRGQYRIFRSSPSTSITHPIQPIPTQFTKGIFLFSTIHNQIVVGPTALDQDSRTDRSVDDKISKQLGAYAKKLLPHLDLERDYIGDYVGIRPGTNQRDYQIHANTDQNWIVCSGIRSTGLTASLGIGNFVIRLLQQTSILLQPKHPQLPIQTRPLPSLKELAEMYQKSGSEKTVCIDGNTYKVTHPLTWHGFAAM